MCAMWVTKDRDRRVWRVNFRDHLGVHRRIQGFTNKRASEQLGRNLEDLAQHVASGSDIPDATAVWVRSNLDDDRRARLIEWGLITERHFLSGVPLEALIEEWSDHIVSEGKTPKHAAEQRYRATTVLVDGCGYQTFGEVEAERVVAEVATVARRRGWSRSTQLACLRSCKMFCGWMVRFGMAARNPMVVVRIGTLKPNEHTRKRRALTVDEANRLIDWVHDHGPVQGWMPGPERALLYQLVIFETGYRAGTVRALRAGDFDLDGDPPTVTGEIKCGRFLTVPITEHYVPLMRRHLDGRGPDELVFRGPQVNWYAKMLARDLEGAGIERFGFNGRVDFHALRHTFLTMASKWMDPRTLQEIAGHTDIKVTMRYYAHRLTSDLARSKAEMGVRGAQRGLHVRPNGGRRGLTGS